MTDNLEQLERDWPQKPPKDLSPLGTVRLFLAVAIMEVVPAESKAVLVILNLRSHHALGLQWSVEALFLMLMILAPSFAVLAFYRLLKRALVASGGSGEHVLYMQFQIARMLMVINAAVYFIVYSLSSLLGHMRVLTG